MAHVTFDSKAILIDGQRQLLLSGAIHYPHSTPEMWPDLLQRSRRCGLNTIESYIFWNLHERDRGRLDFSDRLDLPRFCRAVQEAGLHLILRIGPYICAETNFGGLPPWLRDEPGLLTRTWNEPFQREMARWVRVLVDVLRPYLAPQGGPVILVQFENEYGNVWPLYGADGTRYTDWAIALGQSLNLGIPLVMCSGSAPGALETINGFFAHEELDRHWRQHPEQPAIWTENWPGWYDCWGFERHLRTPESVAWGVARFVAAGGTGVNYYMWHAGTHFGREAMYLQTTAYGFDAPLDEFGLETTKSGHLAELHGLLTSHAETILSAPRPVGEQLGEKQWRFALANGEKPLTFLCNDDSEHAATLAFAGASQTLAPRSVRIFQDGRLLFDTARLAPASVVIRTMEPMKGMLRFASWQEPLPDGWPKALGKPVERERPVEQLSLTHDRSDYCWYCLDVDIGAGEAGDGELLLDGCGDFFYLYLDGRLAGQTRGVLAENRQLRVDTPPAWAGPDWYQEALAALAPEQHDSRDFRQRFTVTLTPGRHRLAFLGCALGLIKGDWMLGYRNMINERKGIWGKAFWNGRELTGRWFMRPGLVGESCRLFAEPGSLVRWRRDGAGAPRRWWRAECGRPKGEDPLALDLTGMGKGLAWVNGRCLGRYWLIPAAMRNATSPGDPVVTTGRGEPTQRYYHVPRSWLRERNVFVLFEEAGGDPASVRICRWAACHPS